MAKKKIEAHANIDASLKIPKTKFVELLEHQIIKGEDLLSVTVPNLIYMDSTHVPKISYFEYQEEDEKKFLEDFERWDRYNDEIYKTSFDVPNSTYRQEYNNHKWDSLVIDIVKEYKDKIKWLINHMKGDIERADLMSQCVEDRVINNKGGIPKSKKIFIVHGHDTNIRTEVENFVRSIGYEPIILCKRADMGDTIIEKIEREAQDVCYAIVIYTACDLGKDKNDSFLQPRARQNVVFEHGFMCAHLGRSYVTALLEEGVEQPGDLQGIIYKTLDDQGMWKYEIAKEMAALKLAVDFNRIG